jgi:Tfp pilus assembly protein PilV
MSFKTKNGRRNQRGIAMLVAMIAMLLLAIIGLGFMFMADTENSVNNSYKDAQKSYFASRAGLENVRLLLVPPDPKTGAGAGPLFFQADGLTMPSVGVNTGVLYVENPTGAADVIDPTTTSGTTPTQNPTLDDELCQEKFVGMATLIAPAQGAPCEASPGNSGLPAATTNYFKAITPATTAGLIVNTNTASALPFKWVRITKKQNFMAEANGGAGRLVDTTQPNQGYQVCWDGKWQWAIDPAASCRLTPSPAAYTQSMMPVWLLTSLSATPALGNKPGSRRITQMEVASDPPLIPNAPISTQAPVTLQGSFQLNAYDSCTCTCTTSSSGSGGNTTTTCGGAGCYSQAHAVQTAGTVNVVGNSGTTTADPTLGSPYLQNVNPWPYDINSLIDQYKTSAASPNWSTGCTGTANFAATPPQYLNCGTQTSQQYGTFPSSMLQNPPIEPTPGSYTSVTEYIPGSVKLTSDANGSGILIVDGDLEINGGLNWYGLILVRGQVSFTGGGSQNVNLFGSILAGEDVLAVNNGTTSVDGDTFGGSINFHYDVCALKKSGGQVPPKLLATHEITY